MFCQVLDFCPSTSFILFYYIFVLFCFFCVLSCAFVLVCILFVLLCWLCNWHLCCEVCTLINTQLNWIELLFITFLQGIYNYITETNHASKVYSFAAILQSQYMAHVGLLLFPMLQTTLNKERGSTETLLPLHQATRRHIPDDFNLHTFLCMLQVRHRHYYASGSIYGCELDSSSQTVSGATSQARLSAPRGTLERAGGAGQSHHPLPVERL